MVLIHFNHVDQEIVLILVVVVLLLTQIIDIITKPMLIGEALVVDWFGMKQLTNQTGFKIYEGYRLC